MIKDRDSEITELKKQNERDKKTIADRDAEILNLIVSQQLISSFRAKSLN